MKKRKRKEWMLLNKETIDLLDKEDWKHYKRGGCLCAAKEARDCICGSLDRRTK